ncbi:MAG: hypothetical protein ACOZBZ_04490 [Patescibacteria group bacterium]
MREREDLSQQIREIKKRALLVLQGERREVILWSFGAPLPKEVEEAILEFEREYEDPRRNIFSSAREEVYSGLRIWVQTKDYPLKGLSSHRDAEIILRQKVRNFPARPPHIPHLPSMPHRFSHQEEWRVINFSWQRILERIREKLASFLRA